jgi:hypothetical protein
MIPRIAEPMDPKQALALTVKDLDQAHHQLEQLKKDLEVIKTKAWQIRQTLAPYKMTKAHPSTVEIANVYNWATQIEEIIHDPAD